jgi:NAD/NADP transhydrogenase beta subunit
MQFWYAAGKTLLENDLLICLPTQGSVPATSLYILCKSMGRDIVRTFFQCVSKYPRTNKGDNLMKTAVEVCKLYAYNPSS